MNKISTVLICLLLFFFCNLPLNAQAKKEEQQSLIEFLKQVESKYNIHFTYADANLEGISVTIPPLSSLEDILDFLKENTSLSFQKIDDKNYAIQKITKSLLAFKTYDLKEVVVNEYLTKGITLKNGGVTNLKPNILGILPGLIEPDVLQTIQALPGIQSVDERISNINIRGGTHDQNLVLWDGIKMYQFGHFFGLISAFNPYLTDDVIISKNGSSALYGDGVSSVIDMRSPDKVNQLFSAGVGANLINADAYGIIPISKKTATQLSFRRSGTDVVSTPTFREFFSRIFQDSDFTNSPNSIQQNEEFFFYDISAKFLYDISEKDKIRVNFLNFFNTLNYEELANLSNRSDALNSELTQASFSGGISYSRQWNPKLSTFAQIYLTNYSLNAINFDVVNDQRLIQQNEVTDNGLRLHLNYEISPSLQYLAGYQFTEVGITNLEDVNNPIFRSRIREVLRTHGGFSEFQFASESKNTIASFGVRANYFEKFNSFLIEPRLSFNQRFLNFFKLEVLGELKSQTTSQIIDLQNDFLGVEQRRWILANKEDIPIIQSQQISTGIHYKRNSLLISVEGYFKNVDGITTRSQGFQNQFQFVNAIGSYQIFGLDFLINKKFGNHISTWLSYSYSENDYNFDDLNNGNLFPNNFDTRHNINFAGNYTYNNFKFAIGLNWRTGRPFTEPDTQTPIIDDEINFQSPNSSRVDDYIRADASATYNFKLDKKGTSAILGVSLWNILDRENIIDSFFTLNRNDNITQVENFSLGFTPNVSFRVEF